MTRIRFPYSEILGSMGAWLPHRGLSQPATSFIGSKSLGIHSLLFLTYSSYQYLFYGQAHRAGKDKNAFN